MATSPLPPTQPRRQILPFTCSGPCLAGDPAMPYAPTTRTVPHYSGVLFSLDISAFHTRLGPFRVVHSNYVRARLNMKRRFSDRPVTFEEHQ
jgi:hypothetical protein